MMMISFVPRVWWERLKESLVHITPKFHMCVIHVQHVTVTIAVGLWPTRGEVTKSALLLALLHVIVGMAIGKQRNAVAIL